MIVNVLVVEVYIDNLLVVYSCFGILWI